MASHAYSLFETPLGICGIAWSERGVSMLLLPGAREAHTRASILHRFPEAEVASTPDFVQRAVAGIQASLAGERRDLSEIALDFEGVPEFYQRVYVAARKVVPGSTVSYGELARRIAAPGAARAVGQALGKNPFAIIVPCHRVLAAGGKLGGFSANGGTSLKVRMLAIEGVLAHVSEPQNASRQGMLFENF